MTTKTVSEWICYLNNSINNNSQVILSGFLPPKKEDGNVNDIYIQLGEGKIYTKITEIYWQFLGLITSTDGGEF